MLDGGLNNSEEKIESEQTNSPSITMIVLNGKGVGSKL